MKIGWLISLQSKGLIANEREDFERSILNPFNLPSWFTSAIDNRRLMPRSEVLVLDSDGEMKARNEAVSRGGC